MIRLECSEPMDLSIVIVNWNSTAFAEKCVASVVASVKTLVYEIVVVDNDSPDGGTQTLETLTPRLRVVFAGRNLGFSRANNLGAAHSTGKTILFLNPDTEVRTEAIDGMYRCLESSREIGIVGCRLLNGDLSVQTSCIQRFPTVSNQFADMERLRMMFPQLTGIGPLFGPVAASAEVEAVSGACLMIRRDVFDRVNGFNTEYFMYAEDIDLCYKVNHAGWSVFHLGSATVVHYGGQSALGQERGSFSAVLTRESLYRFMKTHRGNRYAAAYRVSTVIAAAGRTCVLGAFSVALWVTRRANSVAASRRKWWRVLRWSLGLEQWVKCVGDPNAQASTVVTN